MDAIVATNALPCNLFSQRAHPLNALEIARQPNKHVDFRSRHYLSTLSVFEKKLEKV